MTLLPPLGYLLMLKFLVIIPGPFKHRDAFMGVKPIENPVHKIWRNGSCSAYFRLITPLILFYTVPKPM